jgi:DNA-binding transcriptional LysR family regulator
MDTDFLDTFVAVVDYGSVAEAARRLDLTAAAVAKRIRALEREMGTRLVLRSGRNVRATQAGAAVLGRMREFLREARNLKSIANGDQLLGQLRLGAHQTATYGLLPDVLKSMMEKYPQIEVYILRGRAVEIYASVLKGDIDVAILIEPPFAIPKACGWSVLHEEPLVVLAPASLPGRDPHAVLASEPFIRVDRDSWTGRLVDRYLRQHGIRPKERFELDGFEAIAAMVDRGLGVSLVPDWSPPWPEGLSLRKIPISNRTFARKIGILWTRASARIQLVHAFHNEAVAVLKVRASKRRRE